MIAFPFEYFRVYIYISKKKKKKKKKKKTEYYNSTITISKSYSDNTMFNPAHWPSG